MTNTIISHKIANGNSLEGMINEFIDARYPAIRKEYGLGIRIQTLYMVNTVVLLDRPGKLVLLDTAVILLLILTASDKSGLRPAVHRQAIKIVRGGGILHENTILT